MRDPTAIEQPKFQTCKPGLMRLDKEGNWFHEGVKITHQRTIALFNRSLTRDDQKGYIIQVGREWCLVEVEDTPFMVRQVNLNCERAELVLNDGTIEDMDPKTLRVGSQDVLYCEVKQGRYPARFLRPAYYQLMQRLEEYQEGYGIRLGDRIWQISMDGK